MTDLAEVTKAEAPKVNRELSTARWRNRPSVRFGSVEPPKDKSRPSEDKSDPPEVDKGSQEDNWVTAVSLASDLRVAVGRIYRAAREGTMVHGGYIEQREPTADEFVDLPHCTRSLYRHRPVDQVEPDHEIEPKPEVKPEPSGERVISAPPSLVEAARAFLLDQLPPLASNALQAIEASADCELAISLRRAVRVSLADELGPLFDDYLAAVHGDAS